MTLGSHKRLAGVAISAAAVATILIVLRRPGPAEPRPAPARAPWISLCAGFDQRSETRVIRQAVSAGGMKLVEATHQPRVSDLFRVTSAFFTADGGVGITSAGNQEILVVSPDGGLVQRIGKAGGGPDEFLTLYFGGLRSERDNEVIVAFDAGAGAVKEFTTDGTLIRSTVLKAPQNRSVYQVFPWPNGSFLTVTANASERTAANPQPGVIRRKVPVVLFDSAGSAVSVLDSINGRESLISTDGGFAVFDAPFSTRPWLASSDIGCYFKAIPDGAGVELQNRGGSNLMRIDLPFVDTRMDAQAWRGRLEKMSHSGHSMPKLDAPATRPAWANGILDDMGRLWLEEYHHIDEPAPGWLVIDADASTAMRVTAPPGASALLAVAQERAAVLMRDSMDTEMVYVFDVRSD